MGRADLGIRRLAILKRFELRDCDRHERPHKFEWLVYVRSGKFSGFICKDCHLFLNIDEKDILYPWKGRNAKG